MPRISEIDETAATRLTIPELPWVEKASDTSGLVLGGVYLLAGEPGIGKTTLCMQIAGALAKSGVLTLYLTTEQSLPELKSVAVRVHGTGGRLRDRALNEHLILENEVTDLAQLPAYLDQHVFATTGQYHGVRCVIVDSIQGQGQSAGATAKYKALYDAFKRAKAAGCTMLLTGHATKAGQIAGPKALEHNVDCVYWFRRALRTRLLFVPKNRFGRARLEPMVLEMDKHGRLSESRRASATSAVVHGYTGRSWELAECQARVTLPQWGAKPELSAPFLPAKKVQQLLLALATIPGVEIGDLTHHISCYLPAGARYNNTLDFPLALSLLSSYFRREAPRGVLLAGEVDLNAQVRDVSESYVEDLARLLRNHARSLGVTDVYIAESSVASLRQQLEATGTKQERSSNAFAALLALTSDGWTGRRPAGAGKDGDGLQSARVRVHAVRGVLDGVKALWPDLIVSSND